MVKFRYRKIIDVNDCKMILGCPEIRKFSPQGSQKNKELCETEIEQPEIDRLMKKSFTT